MWSDNMQYVCQPSHGSHLYPEIARQPGERILRTNLRCKIRQSVHKGCMDIRIRFHYGRGNLAWDYLQKDMDFPLV